MSNANDNEAHRYFLFRLADVHEGLEDFEKLEALHESCLCIQAQISINIQLSTGGPGDGFEIICDAKTGEPLHGYHYFINWGFRKEVFLSADELSDVCSAYGIEDGRMFLDTP